MGFKSSQYFFEIVRYPFPDRSLLRVVVASDAFRKEAISVIKDPFPDSALDGKLLPAFFRFNEIPQFLRKRPYRRYQQAWYITARATGFARHAFAAVPDEIAFQQGFYLFLVSALEYIGQGPRIVFVEFCGRTNSCAGPTIDAGFQSFFETDILAEQIVKAPHEGLD
jgi:hypothetical protein